MYCCGNPKIAHRLRSTLTAVGTGVFVGDVSRRVADHLCASVAEGVTGDGGWASVVLPSPSPLGFDVHVFGHQSLEEVDGISLAVLRKSTGKLITK